MSVSKMQLVSLSGPLEMYQETASEIIKLGCFQPEDVRNVLFGYNKLFPLSVDNKSELALKKIEEFASIANVKLQAINNSDSKNHDEILSSLSDALIKIEEIEEKIKEIDVFLNEDEQIIKQLRPLLDLNLDLGKLYGFEFVRFRYGRMSKNAYEFMLKNYSDDSLFIYMPTLFESGFVYGLYFAPEKYIEYADTTFAAFSFDRIMIHDRAKGTPHQAYKSMEEAINQRHIQKEELENERKEIINLFLPNLNMIYTHFLISVKVNELKSYGGRSTENFYISGWVPSSEYKNFCTNLKAIENIICTAEEPSFTKSLIPTNLKNIKLFKPFESFVKMYGMPSYTEIDPTPFVALTYCLLFGIMFGDVGHGLLIILAGAVMALFKKMEFGKILIGCGIASSIFGIFYDSIFGHEGIINRSIFGSEEMKFGFSPSHNVNTILLVAVGLGIALIAVSMLLNIINGIRQRNVEKIFFSNNGLAGLVFYVSLIYAVVQIALLGNSEFLNIFYIVLLIIIPLVIVLFRHPLTRLVRGEKPFPSGIVEFFIENVFELVEILLSFATSTISFVRVGAFALSHAGMMLVVFILAQTTVEASFGTGNVLVLLIGNLFVIGLEGLIVGIQVLRLEYYEMFGRFYSGEGREFVPIRISKN